MQGVGFRVQGAELHQFPFRFRIQGVGIRPPNSKSSQPAAHHLSGVIQLRNDRVTGS